MLAREQADFLRRLGRANGTVERGGFDARKVEIAGVALARKRRRSVAKAWPRLVEALGVRYAASFEGYCTARPWPPEGGPIADGWLLCEWLAERGELPDEGALERAG